MHVERYNFALRWIEYAEPDDGLRLVERDADVEFVELRRDEIPSKLIHPLRELSSGVVQFRELPNRVRVNGHDGFEISGLSATYPHGHCSEMPQCVTLAR